MKKTIFTSLLISVLIGGILIYRTGNFTDEPNPPDFLPEDILLYFNQEDLSTILTEINTSPLGQVITSIDFIKIALDIEAPMSTIEVMQKGREVLTSPGTDHVVDVVLGEDFSFAILPAAVGSNPLEHIRKNGVFFAKPKKDITLMEVFATAYFKNYIVSSRKYGKYLIRRVKRQNNFTAFLVRVGPLFVMAEEERTLRYCLDIFDDKKNSLRSNDLFQEIEKKFREATTFCFFSVELLLKQVRKNLEGESAHRVEESKYFDNWNGFTVGAYGSWHKENSIEDVVTLYFDKKALTPYTADFFGITPEKDTRLSQVPADIFLYYWTNTFNLPVLFDIYANELKDRGQNLLDFKNIFQDRTGYTIEELISLSGSQFSVMISEPSPADFLPIPNLTVIIDLNDVEKGELILHEILALNEVPNNSGSHGDVKFTYWGESIQTGVQPVIAFHKESLYLSSSVRMLKLVLDTPENKKGIISTEIFKQNGHSLLLKNNSIGYIQASSALDAAKELVSWFGTMLAIQNRQFASKSKIVIDGVVHPLLDGLKMFSSVATRSYIRENFISVESTTTITE